MKDKHHIPYYLSIIVLFLAIVIMLYVAYMVLLDGNNVLVYNEPIKVYSVDSNSITLSLDYCKTRNIPVKVYISYIDGIVYSLPPKESASLPVGCHVANKVYEIPDKIPDGIYRIHVDTELRVNNLKTQTFVWESEDFEIKR